MYPIGYNHASVIPIPRWSLHNVVILLSRTQSASLQLQHLLRVLVQDFPFDGFVRREPANRGEDLRAQTFWTGPNRILAIAAEHQFVLMPVQKTGREILVAGQRIQAGAGRAIAEHVRVIAQKPVR